MEFIRKNGAGIAVCVGVAAIATGLAGLSIGGFSLEVVGAPVFAILIGMIVTLAAPEFATQALVAPGVKYTSKKILQYAVVILGFSLDLGTILTVGGKSLPVIVVVVTFAKDSM